MKRAASLIGLGLLAAAATCDAADAQITCIQTYLASSDYKALGFAPSDVEDLVGSVSRGIGLEPDGIMIIPCDGVQKVISIFYIEERDSVPTSDYILYEPQWVQAVIGPTIARDPNNRAYGEAIALFGHELGHLLNRHFTASSKLPRLKKETVADNFAGCAAGVMGVPFEHVEGLLSRIRGDVDTTYPSRTRAIRAAREGYDNCLRGRPVPRDPARVPQLDPIVEPGSVPNPPGDGVWSAIAYENYTVSPGTIFGYSVGAPTREEAIREAVRNCQRIESWNGWGCTTEDRGVEGFEPVIRNGCISLYSNAGGIWRYAKAATKSAAQSKARAARIKANEREMVDPCKRVRSFCASTTG